MKSYRPLPFLPLYHPDIQQTVKQAFVSEMMMKYCCSSLKVE